MAKEIIDVSLSKIKLNSVLGALFPRKKQKALEEAIKKDGYDYGHPVVIWKETDELAHGYTRYHASKAAGRSTIPAVYISFKDLRATVDYVIKIHRDQRELTDDVLLQCVDTMYKTWPVSRSEDGKFNKAVAPDGATVGDFRKSSEEIGALLGTSGRKVERMRTILEHGGDKIINEVKAGLGDDGEGLTVNAAYNLVSEKLAESKELEEKIKRAKKQQEKITEEINDGLKKAKKLKEKLEALEEEMKAQAAGKTKEQREQERKEREEAEKQAAAQAAAEQERQTALQEQVTYVRALNSCNANLPAYPPDVVWEGKIFIKAQVEARSIYEKIEKLLFPGTGKGESHESKQKTGNGGDRKRQGTRSKNIGSGIRQITDGNS